MWGEVGLDVLEEDHEALLLALRAGATTGGHPAPLNRGAAAAPEEGAAGRRSGSPVGTVPSRAILGARGRSQSGAYDPGDGC